MGPDVEKYGESWANTVSTTQDERAGKTQEKLDRILRWVEAYPIDIFPEPNFKKAAEVLKNNGMSIDAISASNMRHVLEGIKTIINA